MKTDVIAFKENASFKPNCFRLEMVALLTALLETAPETTDGRMVVTEGHRNPRHPDDAHTWCSAFDIRSRNVLAETDSAREFELREWASRARARMDDPLGIYQLVVHGGPGPRLHIHAEIDPR